MHNIMMALIANKNFFWERQVLGPLRSNWNSVYWKTDPDPLSCFRFIRLPVVEVGYEAVAEDTLADGQKKAVAVAEVELADVEAAPAEDELGDIKKNTPDSW